MLSSIISVAAGMLLPMAAEPADMADTLRAAAIVADRGIVVSRTDTVTLANTTSITDALKGIPGLLVTDNGGPAGLKTLSLRGLGSSHTVIYVDGVRVSNVQSGQTGLGMLDTDNYGTAVIDYAQNSISFNTRKPSFGDGRFAGAAGLRAGSFGTYEPSLNLGVRLSDDVILSVSANGLTSRGDFPYGESGETRVNSDISQLRASADLWGMITGGQWHAKAYYNGSDRGTPGSIYWPSEDRQTDYNAFVQGVVSKHFSPFYQLHVSAKAAYDDLLYFSSWGDSDYVQKEVQLNTSHKLSPTRCLDLSITADYCWDDLTSTLYSSRRSALTTTGAASLHTRRLKADAGFECYGYSDNGEAPAGALSPSIGLRLNLLEGLDLLGFVRRAYRVPSFNELYYPGFGNPELRAEDAFLSDVGVEYHHSMGEHWSLRAKADGWYNSLKDKITSAPTESDPSIWMPYNIGAVRMLGADAESGISFLSGDTMVSFSARYCLQDCEDITTPDSTSYGQQIPYVPRHIVCLKGDVSVEGWRMSIVWNRYGTRYDSSTLMSDYHTLDVSLSRDLTLGRDSILSLQIHGRNLTDSRYFLSSGYPMPGRSLLGEIDIKF